MVLFAPDMLGVFGVVAALQSRKTDVCVCMHVLCMHAGTHAHMYRFVWKPEDSLGHTVYQLNCFLSPQVMALPKDIKSGLSAA